MKSMKQDWVWNFTLYAFKVIRDFIFFEFSES